MAITNHERVGKALDLLKAGLGPFVEREIKSALESRKLDAHPLRSYGEDRALGNKPIPEQDVAGLLKLMWDTWHDVFREILGPAERSLVSELRGHRNQWAHQESFSSDDAYRSLGFGGPTPCRGIRAAVRRAREAQAGTAAGALRRTDARREAQAGGDGD